MKKTLIVISVSDRVNELNEMIRSIIAKPELDGFDINLLFQDPERVESKIENRDRFRAIYVERGKMGCHGARVKLLQNIEPEGYEVFINLDDDILLTEFTHYEKAIQKALEPETGFVLTNWARTRAMVEAKAAVMADKFVKQIMVYNGGGMVYREEIAALMRALPIIRTAFDCAWPLTAYINGFTNYRFLGSLAIHRVCTKGGMHTFMMQTPKHVMGSEWVNFRPASKQSGNCCDVCIPLDADVKAEAKEAYKAARLRRFQK